MEELCSLLKTKVHLTRTDGIPFIDTYECPNDVKKSFPLLTKSSKYTWNNNEIHFFYINGNCDLKCNHIATLLHLLQPPNYPLRADILLSPVKKYYPEGRIFGPAHVNTGYSSDDKIVVYREEEWFKVFIHECFHFFHFDEKLFNPVLADRIKKIFPVSSPVNLFEAYCETCARTLNCCMIAAVNNINVSLLLPRETKYAMRHMVNILDHMELTYEDIQHKNSSFQEDTNVLAYVILTSILMHSNFIEKNATAMKNFKLIDVESFLKCIEDNYDNDPFVLAIRHTQPRKTTTMSFFSIDNGSYKN